MPYYVSRQSNYYDEGAHSVEIAADLDYSSPGMLSPAYQDAGEGQEYDDVREAAAAAVAVAKRWRADVGRKVDGGLPFRCFTVSMNSYCYPSMGDAMTAPEIVAWARETRQEAHGPDITPADIERARLAQMEALKVLECFGEWQFGNVEYGGFAFAEMQDAPHGADVRVIVGDDDAVEWGDVQPTNNERENASSYYVAIVVYDLETEEEIYHGGIGGIDVIDLPGYQQREWEDAVACALSEYLLDDALRFVETETSEREHWAARDTITV